MLVTLSELGTNSFAQININQHVYFKPTEEGIKILKDRHDELNKEIEIFGGEPLPSFKLDTDQNGYCCMQMWTFMQIFGPYISVTGRTLFETNILFKTKDLRKKVFRNEKQN